MLLQQGHPRTGVSADFTGIGFIQSGEDAKQGGLADSVRTDEGDALAVKEFEAQIRKERIGVKRPRQARGAEEQHEDRIRRYGSARKRSITAESATWRRNE